uniref:Apple domain-containing protein n=1 Tax=Biomphalaria glabrata TaxID=6526 RepID=A0A2C9LUG0_BIOGL
MYGIAVSCVLITSVSMTTGLYNAARFKPSSQSSNYENYYSYLGVDGDYNGAVLSGHCMHTGFERTPWWIVDLLGQFDVQQIKLYNRNEDYISAIRVKNFILDIFDEDPRQLANFPNITGHLCYNQTDPLETTPLLVNCRTSILGRYIRLSMTTDVNNPLHICEMEVLVGSSIYELINFDKLMNTKLVDTPMAQVQLSNSFFCVRECLQRRMSTYCTAVNWITSTRSCQLFSINPFVDLTARLITDQGTDLYIQRI